MSLSGGNHKTISVFNTTSTGGITAGATATARFDTLGYDYIAIDTMLGTADTTSNSPTVLTLGEMDVTNTSSATTITAFTGGTATSTSVSWVIPVTGVVTSITNGANVYRYNVDCRARKRYLLVSVSPATTQVVAFNARLSRGENVPIGSLGTGTNVTSTYMGVAAVVEG